MYLKTNSRKNLNSISVIVFDNDKMTNLDKNFHRICLHNSLIVL